MAQTELSFTQHALVRMNQRGIRQDVIEAIVVHADQTVRCGGDCQAIRVTRTALLALVESGEVLPSMAERLQNLMVIIGHNQEIVSVYPEDKRANRAKVKRTKSFYARRQRRRCRRRSFWGQC